MVAGEVCIRDVVTVGESTTIAEAALIMRRHHVGNVLVTEWCEERNVPLGIVTDRDIAVQVVADRLDPDRVTVGDIMAGSIITAHRAEDITEVLRRMGTAAVRRIPVVDDDDGLVGIISIDDLIEIFAHQMGQLADLILLGQLHEQAGAVPGMLPALLARSPHDGEAPGR